MASLTFLGAAQTVTGSKYLLEVGRTKVLIDCGLFQGLKELRMRNWERLPFNPEHAQAVVLTHAHIDHIGYLPRFVKDGFRGPVFATPATESLAELLLLDAAHNQEEDA
jgi:metallo-beta-lactamase family protein